MQATPFRYRGGLTRPDAAHTNGMKETIMAKKDKTRLHSSKNPLSENIRGSMVELLQKHLATALDITYQTKQAR